MPSFSSNRFGICAVIVGANFLLPPNANGATGDDLLRTVAISTSFGPPQTFQFFFAFINNSGETAFLSSRGAGASTDNWINNPIAGTRRVAGRGEPAAGTPPGVVFDAPLIPIINDSGQVAFRGVIAGAGVTENNNVGLWSEDTAGNLRIVARTGDIAPDTSPGVLFDHINDHTFNNAGHSVFSANLRGPGVTEENEGGIWWSDPAGNTQLVVRSGQPAPGTDANFRGPGGSVSSMNDAVQIVFGAPVTSDRADFGIWHWSPSSGLSLVARRGDRVPGHPGAFPFGALVSPEINNSGHIAFFDTRSGGRTWVRNPDGEYRLVASGGAPAPGTESGVLFSQLNSSVLLNGAGHIATWARLTGPGAIDGNNEGIWAENQSGLQLVARTGNQAPGTSPGVQFVDLNQLTLNGFGHVAFTGLVGGDGVTAMNDRGIWAQRRDGLLRLVVREGEMIDVDDGAGVDFRTVSFIDPLGFLMGSGNEDGRPSTFNDAGQLVFIVNFTDGSSGVFVSNVGTVPEPAVTASVLTLFLVSYRLCRSKR